MKPGNLPDLKSCIGKTVLSIHEIDKRPFPVLLKFSDGTQLAIRPCCCAIYGGAVEEEEQKEFET